MPEKWANKTEKLEKLIEEINKAVDTINAEYDEITKMYLESPMLTAIADQYKRTMNKAETLAYAVTLEKQYQEEQKCKEELEAKQRESLENAQICPDNSGNEVTPENKQTAVSVDSGANQSITGTFRVTCTRDQLISLRDFMKANQIKFEVVKG